MKVNWDDEIPNIWENKIHVPNHQPDMDSEVLNQTEGSEGIVNAVPHLLGCDQIAEGSVEHIKPHAPTFGKKTCARNFKVLLTRQDTANQRCH